MTEHNGVVAAKPAARDVSSREPHPVDEGHESIGFKASVKASGPPGRITARGPRETGGLHAKGPGGLDWVRGEGGCRPRQTCYKPQNDGRQLLDARRSRHNQGNLLSTSDSHTGAPDFYCSLSLYLYLTLALSSPLSLSLLPYHYQLFLFFTSPFLSLSLPYYHYHPFPYSLPPLLFSPFLHVYYGYSLGGPARTG